MINKDYEFKFTDGPWRVSFGNDTGPNDDYYDEWVTVEKDVSDVIAKFDIGYDQESADMAERNARLVAQSPELAEFARKVALLNKDAGIGQGKLNSLIEEAQKLMDEVCGE